MKIFDSLLRDSVFHVPIVISIPMFSPFVLLAMTGSIHFIYSYGFYVAIYILTPFTRAQNVDADLEADRVDVAGTDVTLVTEIEGEDTGGGAAEEDDLTEELEVRRVEVVLRVEVLGARVEELETRVEEVAGRLEEELEPPGGGFGPFTDDSPVF